MHFAWEGYQTLNENVKKLMGLRKKRGPLQRNRRF